MTGGHEKSPDYIETEPQPWLVRIPVFVAMIWFCYWFFA